MKHVLRYLQGTSSLGLHLVPSSSLELIGYSIADSAGCRDNKRSIGAYCVVLGGNLVSWSCGKPKVVARSTAEA